MTKFYTKEKVDRIIADATKLTPVYSEWDIDRGGILSGETLRVEFHATGLNGSWFLDKLTDGEWQSVANDEKTGTPDERKNDTDVKFIVNETVVKATRTIVGYTLAGDPNSPLLVPVTKKTDEQGKTTYEMPPEVNAGVFATPAFKTAVDKEIDEHGGTGFKHDEHGYYIEVEQEA